MIKNLIYRIKRKLLTLFGDLKYYKYPMWLVYCPYTYRVKGKELRVALNSIQPGDLILRGYSDYVDGVFIPGKFSHTGVYVGTDNVIHAIAEGVVIIDILDFLKCDRFCILRPSGDIEEAIKKAYSYVGTDYDFNFEGGDKRLYCHELGAACYQGLIIEKKTPEFLGGLIKRTEKVYLAESFLESPDFTKVFEFVPLS